MFGKPMGKSRAVLQQRIGKQRYEMRLSLVLSLICNPNAQKIDIFRDHAAIAESITSVYSSDAELSSATVPLPTWLGPGFIAEKM